VWPHGGRQPTWGWALLADVRPSPTPRPAQRGLAATGWCGAVERSAVALAGSWLAGAVALGGEVTSSARPVTFADVGGRRPGRAGGRATTGVGRVRAVPAAHSRSRLSAGCPWHPPPCWSFAVGVCRCGSWLVSRWGVLGLGEILGLSTTAAATSRRCPGAVCLLGGAAEVPSPPSPTFGLGESSNPLDWTAAVLRASFPSWRRYLGPCGSRRGWPGCKVLASCSVAAPKLSLLYFGLPRLKLLAALFSSSLGGALCGPSPVVS
jgi:hypothetical protein